MAQQATLTMKARKATWWERLKGCVWRVWYRVNFRINRHLMDGWEWIEAEAETSPKPKKLTNIVKYE